MIGNVVASIVFIESDGTGDPNTENWSDARKTQVISEVTAGLDWWTKQNSRSPLTFTIVTETLSTKYEPITRPYYDENLWIPDAMGKLGYKGTRFSSTRSYVNDLRNKYETDWGFVIFVVDSQADTNGKFVDGLFAYAYLGGPFLVMTYDNNGYGIGNMDVVVAHETGHIFHALDQYAGASSPNDYSKGYFPTINGNHAYSSGATNPDSIMRGGIRWGLDPWSRIMLGWKDSDNNGKDDIVGQSPSANMSSPPSGNSTSGGITSFAGNAAVQVLPRQSNAQGHGLTIDTIAKVEYRLKTGDWADAIAVDGTFDSATENFQIEIPPGENPGSQALTLQDMDVRVTTFFATRNGSTSGTSGGTYAFAAGLQDAHPYPNPFKPNSSLGHSDVTFTGLTTGAKVQIFTVSGEGIFEKEVVSPATTVQWAGTDDDGAKVATGVYFYLITDPEGNKKKGKLAVIR
jgi:hypothetical protein